MNRRRSFAIGCVIVFAVAISASASAATPKIDWSPSTVTAKVVKGETYTSTVTFSSTIDLKDVKLSWSSSLDSVLKVDSVTIGDLPANTITTITLTVTIPSKAKRQAYNGSLWVMAGTKKQPHLRKFANPLSLRFAVSK